VNRAWSKRALARASKMSSAALLAALLVVPQSAAARKQGELGYAYDKVWNAALRMVRVDLRMPVTDRDPEAGYLLFEYLDHDKRYAGSIEIVRMDRDRRVLTKAVVQVQGMPAYVEQMLLDRLDRKLHDEYGAPLEPPAEKPREPKPSEDPTPPSDGPREPGGDAPAP
jgi:hypothetical protein